MRIIQKAIIAGKTLMIEQVPDRRSGYKPRKARTKPTPEAVRKNNWRLAAWKLTAILNANFTANDDFLTLTYKEEPGSEEEARQIINRHIERHRKWARRHGMTWKWVLVTEHNGNRVHHHLVTSGIPKERIIDGWSKEQGIVLVKSLNKDGEHSRLANYIPKEGLNPENKGRYRHMFRRSRNLTVPQPEKVIPKKPIAMDAPPAVPKGYCLVSDTEKEYVEPFFGSRVRRYILLRIDGKPNVMPYKTEPSRYDSIRYVEEEQQMDIWQEGV